MNLSLVYFFIYLAIVVAIGLWSSRKETEEGFMIADRNVHGFQVAATMSAGFLDGFTLATYMAFLYQYGFSATWGFVGFALGFMLLRKYAGKIKQKADELRVYSMPEYFYRLLGKRNGLMFSCFLIIQFFLLLVVYCGDRDKTIFSKDTPARRSGNGVFSTTSLGFEGSRHDTALCCDTFFI